MLHSKVCLKVHKQNETNKMNELKEYLKECIRPQGEHEYYEGEFLNVDMVQDGIAIVKECPEGDNMESVKIGEYYLVRNCKRQLEWLKEDGTIQFDTSSEPLYRRLLPPPYETVNHKFIIECVIRETSNRDKNYVEYGVRSGECINHISKFVSHAYGVDIARKPDLERNITYFKAYTDWFSEQVLSNLEYWYAFVDADHSFDAAMRDFSNLYKYIQPGGYVFLHDTYPCEAGLLSVDGCNDCYKTPIEIKGRYPGVEIITLSLNPGLTIVRK